MLHMLKINRELEIEKCRPNSSLPSQDLKKNQKRRNNKHVYTSCSAIRKFPPLVLRVGALQSELLMSSVLIEIGLLLEVVV